MATTQLPRDAVKYVMDSGVIALRSDWTIKKTIELLRTAPQGSLYYLYVTDKDRRLVGVVSMRSLLLAQPGERLEHIMSAEVISVQADTPREEVLRLAEEKRFLAFPVVDAEGKLIGAIRPAELVRIVQTEAGSSLQRLFGAGRDEHALSSPAFALTKRLPWLQINLATAFLAAFIVGLFESVLARFTALAVLYPVVSGQGANAGMQALAVVMRGLGGREFERRQYWSVVAKEALLGTMNGVVVAAVAAGAVLLWYGNWKIAGVMALATVINMVAAGLSGAGIPIVLKMLGRDPAQSSAIIMTTVTDVVGFASFLGLAAWVLQAPA